MWVLTGKCNRVGSIDEIIRSGAKWASGTVRLEMNGTVVDVTRYRNHPRHKNLVSVMTSSNTTMPRHTRTGTALTSAILNGITYDKILEQLYFASGETAFFCRLQEREQKRLIREKFHFEKFERAGAWIKEHARAIDERYAACSLRIAHLQGELGLAQDLTDRHLKAVKSARKEQRVSAENLARERELSSKVLDAHRAGLAETTAAIESWQINQSELRRTILQLDSVNLQLQQVEQTKTCPTCERPWPKDKQTAQIKEIQKQKKELLRATTTLEQDSAAFDKDSLDKRRDELRVKERSAMEALAVINAQLRLVDTDLVRVTQLYHEARDRLLRVKMNLTLRQQRLHKLDRKAAHYDWLRSAFSSRGMEAYALGRVLPILNHRINEVLGYLPTRRGIIRMRMYLAGERLKLEFHHAGRVGPYESLSGGEGRRVDFSVSYAFQGLTPSACNIWFLDEVFESLDTLGIEQILSVLQKSGKESLFVTSHRADLEGHFRNVVYLREDADRGCVIDRTVHRGLDVTTVGGM
jgi:hypothetical protein